jgi:replicative DNA helicase
MNKKQTIRDERELIHLLLHKKEAIDRFFDYGLESKSFSDENSPIVSYILEAYDRDGVLLTRNAFKEKIKHHKSPKEKISEELAFNSCYAASAVMDDFPMLVKKIVDYNISIRTNKALEMFNKMSKKEGDVFAIRGLMNDFDDILKGTSNLDGKSYYEDIRVLSKQQVQYIEDVRAGKIKEDPLILSGIDEIDYAMVTGFEKGTLTLICADVGGYKSAMMLNIGLNVWNNGFDVLFVPLEMHRDQMWRRACAREARIRLDLITKNVKDLNDEQMEKILKMNEAWESNPAKFYMMQEPGNTTVLKIQRQIERNIEIIKPKLVVIDYVANLEAHKNRYGRNDLEIGDMLKTMRQMGKDLDFAVLSAAQLGRKALERVRKSGADRDKTTINSEDIRGSHEYSADADNIFAQLKHPHQQTELLDIFCVKSRNGPTVFPNGKSRSSLFIRPEYGLITTGEYGERISDDPENDEDNNTCTGNIYDLMDKTEKDGVTVDGGVEEPDNLYDTVVEDNSDIEKSCDDSEDSDEWDDWDNENWDK